MKSLQEWLTLLNNGWYQRMAYETGRSHVHKQTGSYSNACAAVGSMYQIMRGSIGKVYLSTGDLLNALKMAKYEVVGKQKDWQSVRPGDVAFSQDLNNNSLPDHTYIIMGRPDKDGYCLVLDNYEPFPHRRNLLEGERTPLDFFLRYETEPTKRLSLWQLRVALAGFGMLYSIFGLLPKHLQEQLNALRHDEFFNKE